MNVVIPFEHTGLAVEFWHELPRTHFIKTRKPLDMAANIILSEMDIYVPIQ